MPAKATERITIVHSSDGDVIIPTSIDSAVLSTYAGDRVTYLQRLKGGLTMFIPTTYNTTKILPSVLRHNAVITTDSTYVAYSVPSLYTEKDGHPTYYLKRFRMKDTLPIQVSELPTPPNSEIYSKYEDTYILCIDPPVYNESCGRSDILDL